ncbi:hypothetical protein QFC21_001175 [Naganishia friedmannii]|uniref:Uncharacterized protein n=1 Tax=Naganishia friedmannii TaxID=89922 RepID=A0ACC2W9D2_9TREE|nr:hypothetical protein QFC21_001175 [Naganishia friedmannii]
MDHPLSFERQVWINKSLCTLLTFSLNTSRLSGFIHALGRLHETADPVKALYRYIQSFPNAIPTDTGVVLFRLVFPHFTPRRRYHMKEKTLANFIARVMALNDTHASILRNWDDEGKMGQAACLGEEVQKVAQMRALGRGSTSGSTLSLAKVDLLLDELACHSPFSDLGAGK